MRPFQSVEEHLEDLSQIGSSLDDVCHSLCVNYRMSSKDIRKALKHHRRWHYITLEELAFALSQWADDGGLLVIEIDDCDPYSSK